MAFRKRFRRGRKSRGRGRKSRGRGRKSRMRHIVRTKVSTKDMADQTLVKMTKVYQGKMIINQGDSYTTFQIPLNYIGPNNAGVATPINYPVYANQYSRCRILGSAIKLSVFNGAQSYSTSGGPAVSSDSYYEGRVLSMFPSNDDSNFDLTTTGISARELISQPYSKWKLMAIEGGADKATIKEYISCDKLFGRKITEEDDYSIRNLHDTSGIFNDWTSPVNQGDWQITYSTPSGIVLATTDQPISYIAEVTYYSRFEQRIDIQNEFVHG